MTPLCMRNEFHTLIQPATEPRKHQSRYFLRLLAFLLYKAPRLRKQLNWIRVDRSRIDLFQLNPSHIVPNSISPKRSHKVCRPINFLVSKITPKPVTSAPSWIWCKIPIQFSKFAWTPKTRCRTLCELFFSGIEIVLHETKILLHETKILLHGTKIWALNMMPFLFLAVSFSIPLRFHRTLEWTKISYYLTVYLPFHWDFAAPLVLHLSSGDGAMRSSVEWPQLRADTGSGETAAPFAFFMSGLPISNTKLSSWLWWCSDIAKMACWISVSTRRNSHTHGRTLQTIQSIPDSIG